MTAETGDREIVLIVYSRQGCHLCELLIEALLPQARGRAEVRIRDVDTRAEWREAYGLRVPVLLHEGRLICESRLDKAALESVLGRAGR